MKRNLFTLAVLLTSFLSVPGQNSNTVYATSNASAIARQDYSIRDFYRRYLQRENPDLKPVDSLNMPLEYNFGVPYVPENLLRPSKAVKVDSKK